MAIEDQGLTITNEMTAEELRVIISLEGWTAPYFVKTEGSATYDAICPTVEALVDCLRLRGHLALK